LFTLSLLHFSTYLLSLVKPYYPQIRMNELRTPEGTHDAADAEERPERQLRQFAICASAAR
jgi:hypothetical protein